MCDNRQTIMVVDDTPANLLVLEEMLQGKGYRVLAFPSGNMALAAAAKNPPDLILMDILMPEMNGFEVCKRLKENVSLKEIPVLFISALTETEDKIQAFSAGGVDYISKPFECKEVLARVETHLKLKRFQEDMVRKNHELDANYRKLKELEVLRHTLTQMIVHDLRSPLSAILGYIEIALEQKENSISGSQRDFLMQAMTATMELTARISSILDVNRLEEGAMPLDIVKVEVKQLLEKCAGAVKFLAKDRQVLFNLDENITHAECDRNLIERVIINLLQNAAKFAPTHSAIHVHVAPSESSICFSVQDEGPGVPIEFRNSVFEKYVQAKLWKEKNKSGSGLGLAFCKLVVDAHGGSIGVVCPNTGGSIFWFTLPITR